MRTAVSETFARGIFCSNLMFLFSKLLHYHAMRNVIIYLGAISFFGRIIMRQKKGPLTCIHSIYFEFTLYHGGLFEAVLPAAYLFAGQSSQLARSKRQN